MSSPSIAVFAAALALSGSAWAQTAGGPVAQPTDNPRTTPTKSVAPTNQSAEEIIVKEKLSAAGVTGIKDLTRNPDGTWKGRGTKDRTEVAVVVDTDGKVTFH